VRKIITILCVALMLITLAGCSTPASSQKSEEELRAEIKTEMEAEAKLKEELKAELKAEMEAEAKKDQGQNDKQEPEQKPKDGWTSYTNENLKFQTEYPEDWKNDVWSEPGDTPQIGGDINNNEDYSKYLKIGFILLTNEDSQGYLKSPDIVSSKSVKINNGLRVINVIDGQEGAAVILNDIYEYNEEFVLMLSGYKFLESSESLYEEDEGYILLEEIMDTFKRI